MGTLDPVRARLVVMIAVGVLAGVLIGAAAAPRSPVSGTVEVATAPAGAADLQGTWKVAAPKPAHPTSFEVADAIVPAIALYEAPGRPAADGRVIENPTWEGLPVVFRVLDQRRGWLQVSVSARPNGLKAWIKASDVTRRTVPNWIRIELAAKRATVYHGDTPLLQTTVATGRDSAPTPTGSFFIDGIVHLEPGGPYGVGQMSVSAFSDVYQQFGGGIGQIALHGTSAPGLLGQAVSHGCVRFDNDAMTQMFDLGPTGTPVEIVP